MGLHMDDFHNPSVTPVGAGATTGNPSSCSVENLTLEQLAKQKEALESELSALGSVLDSHGVHMRTTLTTFDGFPRSDIDVAQVRTTRARIIHLRNDHKALLARIEAAVHARFAELAAQPEVIYQSSSSPAARNSNSAAAANVSTTHSNNQAATTQPAFARVNSVTPNSPAEVAGLQAGDRITNFGDADWLNHEKLARVAQVVQRNEGRQIVVNIIRGVSVGTNGDIGSKLSLLLTPRRDWGGRGSLGCHLIPL